VRSGNYLRTPDRCGRVMDRSTSFGVALSIIGLAVVIVLAACRSWAQEAGTSPSAKPRTEKDLLGEKEIPANAY